jgi:sterol desaturase/sphingolipid hydroxylase (fatty acid hydroxylase superfamily)
MNGVSFIGPCALLYFFFLDPSLCNPDANRVDLSFNPFTFPVYLALYMIGHDFYFSEIHRHSHVNKFIYRVLHQMHHEYTHDMNGFAVGYAEIVENFLQVGVPWLAWTWFAAPNIWNWLLPLSLTLFTTIVGHSCYQMHPSIAVFHPLIVPLQLTVGKYMLTPGDHQVHHSHRRFNYGLFFRYCDQYHGTYRKCGVKAKNVEYWSKRFRAEGKKYVARGKLERDMKSRKTLTYEEEGVGLHWGF